jgi:hypothetical protein
MTDRNLFPRRYNAYKKDGTHYAIELVPYWDPQPNGPDSPNSWAENPMWDAKIRVNGAAVSRQELLSVQAGSKPILITPTPSNEPSRLQNGDAIDKPVADIVMSHFVELMDELYYQWKLDHSAEDVVDILLSDDE